MEAAARVDEARRPGLADERDELEVVAHHAPRLVVVDAVAVLVVDPVAEHLRAGRVEDDRRAVLVTDRAAEHEDLALPRVVARSAAKRPRGE